MRGPGTQRDRLNALPVDAAAIALVPLLAPHECAAIIAATRDGLGWREATISYGDTARVLSSVRAASILDEAAWPPELDEIRSNLRAATEGLDSARAGGLRAGEIQLVRYWPGGFFMLHRDASEDPKEWRKLSVVVYLNDDFEGGATRFPALELDVPPRCGYALTFPPHYVHEGAPVTRGEKFIFSFWLGR